jgi:ABC-type transport system involved in multi-copper enzyme maturation permease subunit
VAAVALLAFFAWNFPSQSANGRYVLSLFHFCLAVMLFLLAPIGAADAISREKREGTMGLLLLTPLTAREVVVGKIAAHLIRLFYFALMMLPFLTIPVLLGGVGWQDFIVSVLLLVAVAILGIAGGLVSSAVFVGFGASLVWAMIASLLITMVAGCLVTNAALTLFPNRITDDLPFFIRVFMLGPSFMLFPVQAREVAAMLSSSRWLLLGSALALLGFSVPLLWLAVRFCARRVAQLAEFSGETKRQVKFRKQFLTPRLWRGAFRRSMSRKLDKNPFIWLEYRTAWARAARWAMILTVVIIETWLVLDLPSREDFLGVHFTIVWVLAVFLTFKASSSFQSEKESGAFELLLVTPFTEKKLVAGRLRAVASYYSLTLFTLVTLGLLGFTWAGTDYFDNNQLSRAANYTSITASLISVPVCGLYFALRSRTFMASLLWTAGAALFAPICLWGAFNGLTWMAATQGQSPIAAYIQEQLRVNWWPVILGLLLYHVVVTSVSLRASLRLLSTREFMGSR